MNRAAIFVIGIAASLGFGALWHGPLGAGDALAARAELLARQTLDHYEMTKVNALFERRPLTRTMILAGPGDRFQRAEIVRIMSDVPGVAEVRWEKPRSGAIKIPLLIEAELLGLVGFSIGMMLAYLLELRRRARRYDRFF
ncbi:MAG: hypothetical protein LH465_00470 [Sphingomonas bacterium]|nr:hypothetical protein [Sphingomonas bacterium]